MLQYQAELQLSLSSVSFFSPTGPLASPRTQQPKRPGAVASLTGSELYKQVISLPVLESV